MNVVLDCNIWITLVINKQLELVTQVKGKGIEISGCEILRDELIDVLSRPKISRFINEDVIGEVIQLYDRVIKRYSITDIPNVVSDKKDNYLFALCAQAKTDYFVTGDKLLLQEVVYFNTKIVSLAFLRQLLLD